MHRSCTALYGFNDSILIESTHNYHGTMNDSASASDQQRIQQTSVPKTRVLALCMGYFLVLLDVTIVNVALPAMHSDLEVSGPALAWVVDGYAVPLAALLLAAGAVGDRMGHRKIVVIGFAGFGIGSVLCALAPGSGFLIAARAIQGVGAALCLPGTLAMLTELAPDEQSRSRLVGAWAAIGGAALPAGPLLGGAAVSLFGWRSIFWLNVPLIAVAVCVLIRPDRTDRTSRDKQASVDWAGAALLTVAVAAGVSAISEIEHAPAIAASAAAGCLIFGVGFVVWERYTSHRLLQVEPSQRRPLAVAAIVAGVMNLCAQGSLFVLTQVVQTVHGQSPIMAGAIMLPAFLPLPLLGSPAGRLVSKIGPWSTSAIGLAIGAIGFVVTGYAVTGGIGLMLLLGLLLWGIGLGVLTPGVVSAAMQATPDAPGAASGASNTARQLGGAIGVAAFAAAAGSVGSSSFLPQTQWTLFAAGAAFLVAVAVAIWRSRIDQDTPEPS
jgi:DHA2 family methylenomycin A resistance protein-like MFS transporter